MGKTKKCYCIKPNSDDDNQLCKVILFYLKLLVPYGLHLLMPIEYIVPIVGGNERDNTPMRVLINIMLELEELQEAKMQTIK